MTRLTLVLLMMLVAGGNALAEAPASGMVVPLATAEGAPASTEIQPPAARSDFQINAEPSQVAPAKELSSPRPVVAVPRSSSVVVETGVPAWAIVLLILLGAVISASVGVGLVVWLRREEKAERRRSAARTLALELSARLAAFRDVPVPPNTEVGVSFVSSVLALAAFDGAFRALLPAFDLLPLKLAGHITLHYGSVHRIATYVKGQSIAAAVRMLQANRYGGHPCPDAPAMREVHVELAEAFRDVEKLIDHLYRLA